MNPDRSNPDFLGEGFRWYGPGDSVPLAYVRQTGAMEVFTSLHEIPYGELWPREAIRVIFREVMSACLSMEEPQRVSFLGPEGTFSQMAAHKLFGNCMLFAISGGLADVMSMARANAIDPLDALSVFSKFQAGNIIQGRGPRMARGEVTPASFAVAMARKDVGLMIAAARNQPLVAMPCVAKRMDEVIAAGGAGMDIAALGPVRGV